MRALVGRRGRARTVGITGPPGSGKSTLADQLIGILRKRGYRVGVIAVDPSSPFSGGAILGDRLRMQKHSTDEGVFMRSLASRGQLGGLSRATRAATRVLEAAGYDFIIIETVGVGQSEVDIVGAADTVVLVAVPGLGDDIQMIKAGIMEIGDIFVVNKADRDGADRVVREIRSMLETAAAIASGAGARVPDTLASHHVADALGAFTASAGFAGAPGFALDGTGHPVLPPVLKTVAETGEGCEALVDAMIAQHEGLKDSGRIEERRLAAARAELRDLVHLRIADSLAGGSGAALEGQLAAEVAARSRDAGEAADVLFEALSKGGFS